MSDNVAVIEKGWLGGGNTGRNTTIIRSNYLQDPSAAIYEKARSLYETMSQDLNYNVMFSPRGVMMLAQTHHEVRGYQRTAHASDTWPALEMTQQPDHVQVAGDAGAQPAARRHAARRWDQSKQPTGHRAL